MATREVTCKVCKGTKVGPGKKRPPCPKCKATGKVTIEVGPSLVEDEE